MAKEKKRNFWKVLGRIALIAAGVFTAAAVISMIALIPGVGTGVAIALSNITLAAALAGLGVGGLSGITLLVKNIVDRIRNRIANRRATKTEKVNEKEQEKTQEKEQEKEQEKTQENTQEKVEENKQEDVREVAPENEAKQEVAPENEAKQEVAPENEAKPEAAPANEAKPEAAPANEAKPEAAPANEVKPEVAPANEAKQEAAPANEAKPEAAPANEVKPEVAPANEAKPEAAPENNQEQIQNPVQSGNTGEKAVKEKKLSKFDVVYAKLGTEYQQKYEEAKKNADIKETNERAIETMTVDDIVALEKTYEKKLSDLSKKEVLSEEDKKAFIKIRSLVEVYQERKKKVRRAVDKGVEPHSEEAVKLTKRKNKQNSNNRQK